MASRGSDIAEADEPARALLIEPLKLIHLADRPVTERAAKAIAQPLISHEDAEPFGLESSSPLTALEEIEIAAHWLVWMGACFRLRAMAVHVAEHPRGLDHPLGRPLIGLAVSRMACPTRSQDHDATAQP